MHIIPNSRVQLKPALGVAKNFSSSLAVEDRFAYKPIKPLWETNDCCALDLFPDSTEISDSLATLVNGILLTVSLF